MVNPAAEPCPRCGERHDLALTEERWTWFAVCRVCSHVWLVVKEMAEFWETSDKPVDEAA